MDNVGNGIRVNLRVPPWTTAHASATVNGKSPHASAIRAGSYFAVERTWNDGDVLELKVPMRLYAQPMPDDPQLVAFLHGPTVLAAKTDEDLVLTAADAAAALAQIQAARRPMEFRIRLANGTEVPLVPLNQITDETYGVYFHLRLA